MSRETIRGVDAICRSRSQRDPRSGTLPTLLADSGCPLAMYRGVAAPHVGELVQNSSPQQQGWPLRTLATRIGGCLTRRRDDSQLSWIVGMDSDHYLIVR